MKPGSQSDRIVHVLRNAHGWMTTQQILAGAGYCSFSARVSELRAAGYDIRCRKIEGMPPGADAQEYLLVSSPEGLSEPRTAQGASDPAPMPSQRVGHALGASAPGGTLSGSLNPLGEPLSLFPGPAKGAYSA